MIFDACIATPFVVSSVHLYICIVASHLGMLDARRVELKDKVEAELEDGVLVGRSRRWKYRLESCLGQRCYQAGATEGPAQGRKGPRPCFY